MSQKFGTTKLTPIRDDNCAAASILQHVFAALMAKGYDPVAQLTGFVLTGDPTYITSHDNARSMICRLERDEIVEELVRFYFKVDPGKF
ncbi:MAG: IreB family regulatory phosphoprotein [Clostridiales bacterium]|nr:IreB family regulatory phosphoprotein [Clostridiales bacterium]